MQDLTAMNRKGLVTHASFGLVGVVIGVVLVNAYRTHMSEGGGATVHAILEELYFLAGVTIAVLGFVGLRQLRLTREGLDLTRTLDEQGQKREALKLASEQCRYYAETVLPEATEVIKRTATAKCSSAALPVDIMNPKSKIEGGQIEILNFDHKKVEAEMSVMQPITMMNYLEAFAIPFAAGLANDDVGYFETGVAFVQLMQHFMPCFLGLRMSQSARYMSAVVLYERWHKRLVNENLTFMRDNLNQLIQKSK